MSNKKGIVFGAMDLLHPGHLIFLEKCKEKCDFLIVGLHTNPNIERPDKNKPIQSTFERYMQLRACKFVDDIFPYDTEDDICNYISTKPVDIRFLGEDYLGKVCTAEALCLQLNIELVYIPRRHFYSSTELRKRIATQ